MSIKELQVQLEEKQAQLISLKEQIEAGDAEAIKSGAELDTEIADLNSQIDTINESAEKAKAALASIGTKEDDTMQNEGLKSLNLAYLKSNRGSVGIDVKADPVAIVTPTIDTLDRKVVDPRPGFGVRDLFSRETISGNSLTYFVLNGKEGGAAVTAEGATKPQIEIKYTPKTEALEKIAAYLKESDELLSDAPFLESVVRGRGVYETNLAIEAYLVNKLLGTSGIQTNSSGITADNILKAKMDISNVTGYEADGIILNPADLLTLLTSKDKNGQYLFGGPAYAPYGNGAYRSGYPTIWGMNVTESADMPSGTCVVGAYKMGASIVTKNNEGFRVEVSNSNEDDFIRNMITVRIEERLLEVVRVPAAFVKIGATVTT